jgi:peptidoglycan/LPS O-acetylase OafA/YrhL
MLLGTKKNQKNFSKEIQSLRGLSIILVILYHANLEYFQFGFIGVDIFFVISGFLISKQIYLKILSNNFNILEFFFRRIQRVYPLIVLCLIFVLIISYFVILPINLIDISKTSIFSIFGLSNYYFVFNQFQYGNDGNFLNPLLHLWSLSVEIQFYIIFPILLIAFFKLFGRKGVLFLILFLTIVSFYFSFITSNKVNFFSIHTRLWEFFFGFFCYLLSINYLFSKYKSTLLSSVLVLLAFIGFYASLFLFPKETVHPGFFTIIPVLSACLYLLFCKYSIFANFLNNKFIITTGYLSYSLYIWHYPVLSFFRNIFTQYNVFIYIFIFILIFLLSFLSFFIENKIRYKKNKKIIFCYLLFCVLIIFVSLYNISGNGLKLRFPNYLSSIKNFRTINTEFMSLNQNLCLNKNKSEKLNSPEKFNKKFLCQLTAGKKNLILMGDSHSITLTNELLDFIKNNKLDFNFYVLANYNCFTSINLRNKSCDSNFENETKHFLENIEDSILIIFNRYSWYLDNPDVKFYNNNDDIINGNKLINYYVQGILEISKKNQIILLYPIPEPGFNIVHKSLEDYILKRQKTIYSKEYSFYIKSNNKFIEAFNNIINPNIKKIELADLFCDNIKCYFNDFDNLFFVDDNHMSSVAVKKVINKVGSILK